MKKTKLFLSAVILISLFASCDDDGFVISSSSSSESIASASDYSAFKILNGVTVRDSILFRTGDTVFSLLFEIVSPVVDNVTLLDVRTAQQKVVVLPYDTLLVYPEFIVKDTVEYLVRWSEGSDENNIHFRFIIEGDGETISWQHRYW